jgi:hypothetical protein
MQRYLSWVSSRPFRQTSSPSAPVVSVSSDSALSTQHSALLARLLAPLGLGLVTLAVFWNDLTRGVAYYGQDSVAFYYPLMTWYAAQLKAGHLPLWLPYIFGGYPLFADGEVGMLYPPNLLAFGLLPSDIAFIGLRPLHFWLAGLFTYWFGRLLGQSRVGAMLAGLTFSYGSFLVGHLQHENLVRSTVWLPLALGLLELALRAEGRRRLGWLLGCGAVVGVQMLGVHVQPVLLTLLALAAYALVGPLGRTTGPLPPSAVQPALSPGLSLPNGLPKGRRTPGWRRLIAHWFSRLLAVSLIVGIGLGLAAVQLLPLYQFGQRSMRVSGLSYEFSTSYSVPLVQLVQLVLPYFFRLDRNTYWGLWGADETTIYIGIAPLLLSLVALAYVRTRPVAFFGLLAGLGLLLALGDYLPVKLYSLIWSLPGFSFLRVPARFSLFFVLGGALLAGFGADRLAGRTFDQQVGLGRRARLRRLTFLALGFGLGAVILAALFSLAREWLDRNPGEARRLIETTYLTLRRGDWRLSASPVYFGLLRSLDLGNRWTLGGLALMACSATWLLLRAYRHAPRRLWQAGLLTLVALDLVTFAQGFYPQKEVGALKVSTPVVEFLAEHNGLHRVFVEPALFNRLGPNQLVPSGIDFAGGYSSLEPRRALDYWWSVVRQDQVLLDLDNVRYVVSPRATPGLLSFDGTLYHPSDRLMRGALGNPSGTETFQFEPWWTESISVVASGERLRDVPYGEPLAEITIRGPSGEQRLLLRSGADVDDEAAPRLGPPLPGAAFGPRIAWSGPSFQNPHELSALSGTTLPLEEPLLATSLTIQRMGPNVALDVYGVGLHDRPGLPVRSLMPTDRAKYRLVYQDEYVNVFENTAALPRAFLVGSARVAAGARPIVDQLILGTFDPRRQLLLEGDSGQELGPRPPSDEVGSAQILEHGPERVVVRAIARLPGYLVLGDRYEEDWQVRVDGHTVPLLRANALFRAVPLEAGEHEVMFSYEPAAVRVGAAVSLVSVALVLAGLWGVRAYGRPLLPRRLGSYNPGAMPRRCAQATAPRNPNAESVEGSRP